MSTKKQESYIGQVAVSIEGTAPLLFHHFSVEALDGSRKAAPRGSAGNNPDEWRDTVLVTGPQNQLYLDPTYIYACCRDGGKSVRRRQRGNLQRAVSSTLQVVDAQILLDDRFLPEGLTTPPPTDPSLPVYLDVRGVRNPSTKARNVRYRIACSRGWTCKFHLFWDTTVFNHDELHAVLIDAGRLSGVGDGRGIGFGRFQILKFETLV